MSLPFSLLTLLFPRPGPSLRTHTLPHLSHSHFHRCRSPVLPSADRPPLAHRTTSFSKRHASFDTPREVPLPYMPSRTHDVSLASSPPARPGPESESRATDAFPGYRHPLPDHRADGGAPGVPDALASPYHGALAQQQPQPAGSPTPHYMDATEDDAMSAPTSPGVAGAIVAGSQQPPLNRSMSGPVHLSSRPFSSGEPSRIYSPTPVRPGQPADRSSTASLPLPMHTPYHTLPSMSGEAGVIVEGEPTPMPMPPSNTAIPSSASFPQAGPSVPRTLTVENTSTPSATSNANVVSSSGTMTTSRSPDWRRENSEMRQVVSSSPTSTQPTAVPRPLTVPHQPPIVHAPPPPVLREHVEAAHEPFLSQAPPPQDSYLAVETNPRQYRLTARLPGFRRDAM